MKSSYTCIEVFFLKKPKDISFSFSIKYYHQQLMFIQIFSSSQNKFTIPQNIFRSLSKTDIEIDLETVFIYCCLDCPSCSANAIQMGWATWAIWAVIKKHG